MLTFIPGKSVNQISSLLSSTPFMLKCAKKFAEISDQAMGCAFIPIPKLLIVKSVFLILNTTRFDKREKVEMMSKNKNRANFNDFVLVQRA